jgi:hypothetical protein
MRDRDPLSQVDRLIDESKKRIARQREVISTAFQKGHDSEVPVSMLRAFEVSLRAFERHRQLIPSSWLWPAASVGLLSVWATLGRQGMWSRSGDNFSRPAGKFLIVDGIGWRSRSRRSRRPFWVDQLE